MLHLAAAKLHLIFIIRKYSTPFSFIRNFFYTFLSASSILSTFRCHNKCPAIRLAPQEHLNLAGLRFLLFVWRSDYFELQKRVL